MLVTDMNNSAGSAQIQSDLAALYNSIVSGSLDAIGGTALQQTYDTSIQTVVALGADIVAASSNTVVADLAGLYSTVTSAIAAPTIGSSAIQNFQSVVAAANALLADVPNSFDSTRILNDNQSLFQAVIANVIATVYGQAAQQAYVQTLQEQTKVEIDLGSNAPLAQYTADESALANNSVAGLMAALGGPAMQQAYAAALQTYDTLKLDAFGTPRASAAQILTDAGTADSAVVTVLGLINSDSQTNFAAALTGNAQTLDQFWAASETGGENYFQNLADQIIYYQNAFSQVYQQYSTDLLNNDGIETQQDVTYSHQLTAYQGSLAQLAAAFFVGAEEGPRGGMDVQSFGSDLAGPTAGPPPDFPNGPPADPPPDDMWDGAGGGAPGGGSGGGGSSSGGWWGDAHLTTYDGLHFDFQAEGEFVVSRATRPGDSFQVQARLQPWFSGSSVSVTTQIAAPVGSDRVTFGVGRADTVWVDGTPSNLSAANPLIYLDGGKLLQLSSTSYEIIWNTGEVLEVNNSGSYLNISIGLPTNIYPGSVEGLLGPNGEGQASDFQLADGTVLSQPLSSSELYGEFANAWRLTQATSLLDYGPGQTTTTFTDLNFPSDALSLANLPQTVVNQAASAVTAAGITDPNLAADAELDYIATGDLSFIAASLNVQQQGIVTTQAGVTATPPSTAIGVDAVSSSVVASNAGTTAVNFNVYLTSAVGTDTTVQYAVVAPGAGYFDAAAFGGTLPSGEVVISAGQTSAHFTIILPLGALGAQPNESLEVGISSGGQPIFAPTATAVVVNSQSEPGVQAVPALAQVSPIGSLTQNGNAYTLNLGAVMQGAPLPSIKLALSNSAAGPADELTGIFSTGAGAGFNLSAIGAITPLAAGQSDWFYVTADNSALGTNSETFTFSPTDTNASGYSAILPNLTLTITDTVEAPAQAALNTASQITLPNVRVGVPDMQALSVTNSAIPPGASLDVSLSMINNATGTGTITQLGASATDNTDIQIGIDTTTAGPKKGNVTLHLLSDAGNGTISDLPNQNVEVFGSVYRPGTSSISGLIVHVGDPTTEALSITNSDPADGYSENLIASVVSATSGVTITGSTTGDIAPQATSNVISAGFSTASTGTMGSVTLDFTTDGTGIDGLGTLDLGQQTLPVTVNNFASAAFELVSGGGTLTHSGTAYTLNLGTVNYDTPAVTANLGVLNGAVGPADLLSGTFIVSGGTGFTNSGFAAFSTISAGQADTTPSVTLNTHKMGSFSETITLHPTGYNPGGYVGVLADETLTISGTVQPSHTVSGGLTFAISSGQTSAGIAVLSGGTLNVLSGGTAMDTFVSSGGALVVSSGGVADPTIISSGGFETISSGGTDNGALVSGGTQDVYGTASGATVFAGVQVAESGGTISGTIISGGGLVNVLAGGMAGSVNVASGGFQQDLGSASGTRDRNQRHRIRLFRRHGSRRNGQRYPVGMGRRHRQRRAYQQRGPAADCRLGLRHGAVGRRTGDRVLRRHRSRRNGQRYPADLGRRRGERRAYQQRGLAAGSRLGLRHGGVGRRNGGRVPRRYGSRRNGQRYPADLGRRHRQRRAYQQRGLAAGCRLGLRHGGVGRRPGDRVLRRHRSKRNGQRYPADLGRRRCQRRAYQQRGRAAESRLGLRHGGVGRRNRGRLLRRYGSRGNGQRYPTDVGRRHRQRRAYQQRRLATGCRLGLRHGAVGWRTGDRVLRRHGQRHHHQ